MNPGVVQKTVIEALNALYGPPAIHILQLKQFHMTLVTTISADPLCIMCATLCLDMAQKEALGSVW